MANRRVTMQSFIRQFQVEQTPYHKPTGHAAVTQRGRIVYFAVPIFRAYARHGYPVYRQLVGNSLRRLLPEPLVRLTHSGVPSRRGNHSNRRKNAVTASKSSTVMPIWWKRLMGA